MDITAPQSLQSSRIDSLDLLRGFALLGILIMNIQSFAMPSQGYFNPFAFNGIEGSVLDTQGMELLNLNGITYMFAHIFADQKFMTIFALLFGVGIALMVETHKNKPPLVNGKPTTSLRFLLRRNFFLLLIGLGHTYLIWEGDILVTYSLCGFFVIWFRNKSVVFLISLASFLFMLPIFMFCMVGIFMPPELVTTELEADWIISAEQLQSISEIMRSNWLEQMTYRAPAALEIQIELFLIYSFWRVSSLMLLGMALHKLGLFRNKISPATLGKWALIAAPTGWSLTAWGVYQNDIYQWHAFYSNVFGSQFNYFGSLISGIGYIFGLLYVAQHIPAWICCVLQSVGCTALSNYILQSLICGLIFYGHGFGLFAQLDRLQQLLIVPVIWVLQSILSTLWLKHFRQGPLERFWRCAVSRSAFALKT